VNHFWADIKAPQWGWGLWTTDGFFAKVKVGDKVSVANMRLVIQNRRNLIIDFVLGSLPILSKCFQARAEVGGLRSIDPSRRKVNISAKRILLSPERLQKIILLFRGKFFKSLEQLNGQSAHNISVARVDEGCTEIFA
jgi:hypothetical protein